jgi:hypothetical protein
MKSDLYEILPAIELVNRDPVAKAAFNLVTHNLGISGFAVARQLNEKPERIQNALESLRDIHVLASGSSSLRDNFTLSGSGFRLMEYLGSK